MSYRILYSDNADVTPPAIGTVDGTVSGGSVQFTVTTPDNDAASATILYLARSSTSGQAWTSVPLVKSTDGHTFTGAHAVSTPTVEQYFVQLVDNANNVSMSSKKGQDFAAPAQPADSGTPDILLSGTPIGGHVVGAQTVTVIGATTYTVDSGVAQPYTGPFTVPGVGQHTVTATNPAGTSQVTFTIDIVAPSITITSPSSSTVYRVGDVIPATFSCSPATVSCTGSPTPPDSSFGVHTFTVTAGTGAGATTLSVTYAVRAKFVGVLQPVDDGPGQTASIFKKGSTVPVKFQLVDATGRPLPDATASAVAANCGATIGLTLAGATSAPVDEAALSNAADSGTCFRYDAAADQFIFNLSTKTLTAGSLYALTIRFPQRAAVDHTVMIGFR
jgi:hypothetical protein